jgi:hypothetical protein
VLAIRRKCGKQPVAIPQILRNRGSRTGALFHYDKAQQRAGEHVPFSISNGIAFGIQLSCVRDTRDHSTIGEWLASLGSFNSRATRVLLVDLPSIVAIDAVVQDARFVVRWESELRFDPMRPYDWRERGYPDQSDNEVSRKIHDLTPFANVRNSHAVTVRDAASGIARRHPGFSRDSGSFPAKTGTYMPPGQPLALAAPQQRAQRRTNERDPTPLPLKNVLRLHRLPIWKRAPLPRSAVRKAQQTTP